MKAYGHQKTLFIQGGKYKWSYKNDCCIGCKRTTFKHKGNGLCLGCYDKERAKKRKGALKRQTWKNYYKNRVLLFLEKTEFKKREKKFDLIAYRKKYYQENKERLLQKERDRKAQIRKKKEERERHAKMILLGDSWKRDKLFNW